MNADLDALLDTALELGLPDHVMVSLARVVNLMWLQERRSVTLPAANLMAYLGIESRNTLDAHLKAYARVPGLTVKKASGHVLIHYRPLPNERATAAQSARSPDGASEEVSTAAQSLPNERAVAAQSVVDGESVDAFLEALAELGDGRPLFGGREMSRADVRAVLEAAGRQGHSLDLVLAEVLALEEEFRRKGREMGSPVALLRHWVAQPDLAEHIPRSLLQQAREILGLQDEGEDERGDTGPGVYEVPLSASQRLDLPRARRVWDEAQQALIRQGESWAKEAGLVAYDAGERTFLVEMPRSQEEDLEERLALIRDALQAVLAEEGTHPPYRLPHVWLKAKARLREVLGRSGYNTWLRDARLLAWEDGEFAIGVPNGFTKDWLTKRLSRQVRETLAHVADVPVEAISVRYVVDV